MDQSAPPATDAPSRMRSVCIIPARGGSKRIPRKNILDFCGKPIISYSISAALDSAIFDLVMVSTDDEEIAEVSRQAGAEVPFLRSKEAADDYSTLSMVVKEVLQELKIRGQVFDAFCCMLPTALFVRGSTLKCAQKMLTSNPKVDSVMPIVGFEYPVPRGLKKRAHEDGNQYLEMVWPEYIETRSQDCEPWYHDVGQFYWMLVSYFDKHEPKWMLGDCTVPLEIPASEVQDIDTLEDWKIAELKYQLRSMAEAGSRRC